MIEEKLKLLSLNHKTSSCSSGPSGKECWINQSSDLAFNFGALHTSVDRADADADGIVGFVPAHDCNGDGRAGSTGPGWIRWRRRRLLAHPGRWPLVIDGWRFRPMACCCGVFLLSWFAGCTR